MAFKLGDAAKQAHSKSKPTKVDHSKPVYPTVVVGAQAVQLKPASAAYVKESNEITALRLPIAHHRFALWFDSKGRFQLKDCGTNEKAANFIEQIRSGRSGN